MLRFLSKKSSNDGTRALLPFKKVIDKSALEEATGQIWECVSVSRSQFRAHYIGTITNVALYMQDKELLTEALKGSVDGLQSTLLRRLPDDRPREQGAPVEQLWKYTLFLCHLLSHASTIHRDWYDKDGRLIMTIDPAQKGIRFKNKQGADERVNMLTRSLSGIIPVCSAQWVMQDEGRCMAEINKAASGLPCFIDHRDDVEATPHLGSVTMPERPSPILPEDPAFSAPDAPATEAIHHPDRADGHHGDNVVTIPAALPATAKGSAGAPQKKKKRRTSTTPSEVPAERQLSLFDERSPDNRREGIRSVDVEPVSDKKVLPDADVVALSEVSGRGEIVVSDEVELKVETGNLFHENSDINEFLGWLDINAEWEISRCGKKVFNYQKYLQKYINRLDRPVAFAEFSKNLINAGFKRITDEDNRQLMAVPEVEG